jgi:2-polyprenyl-3-methyl-5-hydroxy-6-metoxy-1,4-benzoquinol methylase
MGREADASVYDELHATAEAYNVPPEQSVYYPLFVRVVSEIEMRGVASVLEVGCGSGGLAQVLKKRTHANYRGFDFSTVAVQNAVRMTGDAQAFRVGDALDPASYNFPYDGIVCTEVLEHIGRDLDVVKMWKPGVQCVCSVPNFDDPTHVRRFGHEDEVRNRYGHLIEIDTVVRVPRPLLRGRTLGEYFRRVRWARNEPKKMLGLLGINTFDWYAGWFVFAGRRNG